VVVAVGRWSLFECVAQVYYRAGVARLFCSRAKFENYFVTGAASFKIGTKFCKAEFIFFVFLMLIEKK